VEDFIRNPGLMTNRNVTVFEFTESVGFISDLTTLAIFYIHNNQTIEKEIF